MPCRKEDGHEQLAMGKCKTRTFLLDRAGALRCQESCRVILTLEHSLWDPVAAPPSLRLASLQTSKNQGTALLRMLKEKQLQLGA